MVTKKAWGGKGLFGSHFQVIVITGSQGRSLEAGNEAEVTFLVCFLVQTRTTHIGLGPPTLISNPENIPIHLPTNQSDGGFFSIKLPSSQMTIVCVKLIKTNQHTHKCLVSGAADCNFST